MSTRLCHCLQKSIEDSRFLHDQKHDYANICLQFRNCNPSCPDKRAKLVQHLLRLDKTDHQSAKCGSRCEFHNKTRSAASRYVTPHVLSKQQQQCSKTNGAAHSARLSENPRVPITTTTTQTDGLNGIGLLHTHAIKRHSAKMSADL